MNPKISIIVPIYNVEKYLNRCIESILNETFADFELILVNDGSTDSCPTICDYYAKNDNRVKVIHKKNEGAGVARNCGIDVATGDYITFVDSDDYIHKDMYNIMYGYAMQEAADIVICDYLMVDGLVNQIIDPNFKINYVNRQQLLLDMYSSNQTFAVVVWNKLFKRELFIDVRYPQGHIIDDETIIYKLIYKSDKIIHLPLKLYYYFNNSMSVTRNKEINPKKLLIIEALEERAEYFKTNENELYLKTIDRLFYFIMLYMDALFFEQFNDIKYYNYVKIKFLANRMNFINNKYIPLFRKILILISFINYNLFQVVYFSLKKLKKFLWRRLLPILYKEGSNDEKDRYYYN